MASTNTIVRLVSGLNVSLWSQMAINALLIYDAIITLDEEVKYFWKPSFNSIGLLFFLVINYLPRHPLYLRPFSDEMQQYLELYHDIFRIFSCRRWIKLYDATHILLLDGLTRASGAISGWSASLLDLIIILCMDYILLLRVRALYSIETQRKGLILCMHIAYFANALVAFGSLITYFRRAGVVAYEIADGIKVCTVTNNPIELRCLYWSASLIFESILLGMALYKATHIRKCLGFRGLKLMKAVVIDQAMYYALVIICGVVNIVTNVDGLSLPVFFTIMNTLGSAQLLPLQGVRMLIRLKKIAEKTNESGSNLGITSDASVAEFRTYSVHSDELPAEVAWSLGE